MDFDKFLGEMQKLITSSQQGDLFGNKKIFTEKSVEICEKFLRGQGYSIGLPYKYPFNIKKLDELIDMFYAMMRNSYQSHLWSNPNGKRDRAVAKSFVERRMNAGKTKRSVALQQCGLIIQTIFTNKDTFKFDTAPGFGILGQGEMAWVTDRALQIINKQLAKSEAKATEDAITAMTERIEEKFPNLGFSLDELKAIRNKLEVQNGKKEG